MYTRPFGLKLLVFYINSNEKIKGFQELTKFWEGSKCSCNTFLDSRILVMLFFLKKWLTSFKNVLQAIAQNLYIIVIIALIIRLLLCYCILLCCINVLFVYYENKNPTLFEVGID